MASESKRAKVEVTAENVILICTRHKNPGDSEEDSETGGLSSGEEFELDQQLQDENSSESDAETLADVEQDGNDPDFTASEEETTGGRPQEQRVTRGRGRGAHSHRVKALGAAQPHNSYDDPDTGNQLPPFHPQRPPGLHLDAPVTKGAMTEAVDFLKLFLTDALLLQICNHTNTYAWEEILKKPYYGTLDGAWKETSPDEILRLLALIMYCGLVPIRSLHHYWSTKTLYHGLWARSIMSRDRYKALMAMLQIVDPGAGDEQDELCKITSMLETFKATCKGLYQPFQHVSVDERMGKHKSVSGVQQHIENKPTKRGMKLWVLMDSLNGYTYDFDIFTGHRNAHESVSDNGLGYDVVMRLTSSLAQQGYHVYFDSFYTSPKLVKDLFQLQMPSCGAANRRAFPEAVKGGKRWAKGKPRGAMRWVRDDCCLALQWKDSKPVTILSSVHMAEEFLHVKRKEKVADKWRAVRVKQPKAVYDYNAYMNGINQSDQVVVNSPALQMCMRWWKTLFFHMVDIAVVNSFILFQLHRAENPDVPELKRAHTYTLTEYREELIRQLAGLDESGLPPVYNPSLREPGDFHTEHIPQVSNIKRTCRVCYDATKQSLKVVTFCSAPQCMVFLHIRHDKNCFELWHDKKYKRRKK